jgi:hypothetical protein
MSRAHVACGLAVALMLAAAACSKKNDKLALSKDRISAGSDVKPSDAATFSAQRCVAGPVSGVSVVLCEYGSPDALAQGKKAAEKWLGEATTGIVLDRETILLAAADRDHKDPKGEALQKLGKRFLEK